MPLTSHCIEMANITLPTPFAVSQMHVTVITLCDSPVVFCREGYYTYIITKPSQSAALQSDSNLNRLVLSLPLTKNALHSPSTSIFFERCVRCVLYNGRLIPYLGCFYNVRVWNVVSSVGCYY